jgi:hypothetical protein
VTSMFPLLSSTVLAFVCATASAAVLPRSSAVHLAVSPQCGTLSGGVPTDVNVGLGPLNSYKTIVTFGGEYQCFFLRVASESQYHVQIHILVVRPMDPPGCKTLPLPQALN